MLWVLTEEIAHYKAKVQKFVDGKEVDSASLTAADWKASNGDHPGSLRRTKSGEVWIETCVRGKPSPSKGVAPVCREKGYLRLDTKPFTSQRSDLRFETRPRRRRPGDNNSATSSSPRLPYDRSRRARNDPLKAYDGLWKIERNAKIIGEVPGEQLLLAPR